MNSYPVDILSAVKSKNLTNSIINLLNNGKATQKVGIYTCLESNKNLDLLKSGKHQKSATKNTSSVKQESNQNDMEDADFDKENMDPKFSNYQAQSKNQVKQEAVAEEDDDFGPLQMQIQDVEIVDTEVYDFKQDIDLDFLNIVDNSIQFSDFDCYRSVDILKSAETFEKIANLNPKCQNVLQILPVSNFSLNNNLSFCFLKFQQLNRAKIENSNLPHQFVELYHMPDFAETDISDFLENFQDQFDTKVKSLSGYARIEISEKKEDSSKVETEPENSETKEEIPQNQTIILANWSNVAKKSSFNLPIGKIPSDSKIQIDLKMHITDFTQGFLCHIKMLETLISQQKLFKPENSENQMLKPETVFKNSNISLATLDTLDKLWLEIYKLKNVESIKKLIMNFIKMCNTKIDSSMSIRDEIIDATNNTEDEEPSIFVKAISDAIKSHKPLSKNEIRRILPSTEIGEFINIMIDLGIRFLNFTLKSSKIYNYVCQIAPKEKGTRIQYLEYLYLKNYSLELNKLTSVKKLMKEREKPKERSNSGENDFSNFSNDVTGFSDNNTGTNWLIQTSWEDESRAKIFALFYNVLRRALEML